MAGVSGIKEHMQVIGADGVPVGTVKSRMHTAVALLKDRLAREGFEP